MAITPNALNVYASYNNIFTFGCLTKGEVNSASYRGSGPSKVIIKSSGTGGENKVTTADEDALGIRAEYFIDNVNIESLITPTAGTRVTNATRITFTVTEPYSMGLFLQACKIAAIENGYVNYIQAGFLLMVEFIGWDDNGNFIDSGSNTRYYPLKLTNVTFTVTGEGTVYDVQAIPWNEQALIDQVERTHTDISILGKDVETILEKGPDSLTSVFNAREEELLAEKKIRETNTYKIEFPDADAPNTIKTSKFIESHNDAGNVPMHPIHETWEPASKTYNRAKNIQDEEERTFVFPGSTKITRMIEEAVIVSEYGKELKDRAPDGNGMVDWFRIDTEVKLKESQAQEQLEGSDAKEFIFKVIPYKVHHTVIAKPSDAGKSYAALRGAAVKEYNYIYTGENIDVIDFNIDVNAGFFTLIGADYNQNSTERQTGYAGQNAVEQDQTETNISDESGNQGEAGNHLVNVIDRFSTGGGGGSRVDNAKIRVARQFHDAVINGGVDLINLELTIHGDPYFIADSGMGNYTAGIKSLNETSDGTVNYQGSEVDIIVNFQTAVDYLEGSGVMKLVPAYSGLYRVVRITNTWEGNKFSQTLNLLRRRMQDEEPVGGGQDNSVKDAPKPEQSYLDRDPTTSPCGGPGGGGAGGGGGGGGGAGGAGESGPAGGPTPNSATVPGSSSPSRGPDDGLRGGQEPNRPTAPASSRFGTFNADGTVQGPGQAARPGNFRANTTRASRATPSVNSGAPGFRGPQ